MLRALYSAASGMSAQQTSVDNIANNLANSNTVGYKTRRAQFQDLMYQNVQQVGAQSTQNTQYSTGLTLGTGVRIVATEKDYTQGSVLQTNGSLDMSVNGRGFLQITQPDGTIAYTRDGAFSLDNQGNVVTASGYPLQPAINIPAGTQSVTIGADGVVTPAAVSGDGDRATRPQACRPLRARRRARNACGCSRDPPRIARSTAPGRDSRAPRRRRSFPDRRR